MPSTRRSGTTYAVERQACVMSDEVSHLWRGPITDDEMVDLMDPPVAGLCPAGGTGSARSAWVGSLPAPPMASFGFVNVAWDGGDHAFLIDTETRRGWHRHGSEPTSSDELHFTRRPPAASGSTLTSSPARCPSIRRMWLSFDRRWARHLYSLE